MTRPGSTFHPGAALALALLGPLAGCDEEPLIIDPFPVRTDIADGPIMVAAAVDDGPPLEVVVDTLTPVTILDSFQPGTDLPEPRRRLVDLTLFGLGEGRTPTVPRGRIPNVETLELHPCGTPDYCAAGEAGRLREIRGVIGGDILSRSAVRLQFSDSSMRFFPDTAGTNADRGESCEAVIDGVFAGGGTLVIGENEVRYSGNRAAVGVCLGEIPEADPAEPAEAGVDALLAVSTGVGPTVLSEAAYQRYAARYDAPAIADLPETELFLPSGAVVARVGEVARMALVGSAGTDSRQRGPCRELYAHKVLTQGLCTGDQIDDCPCPDNEVFCRAGAALELNEIARVLIIPNGSQVLQSLRTELRPDVPEVDGLLGTEILRNTTIELDYPNGRLLGKCASGGEGDCTTRPALRTLGNRRLIRDCMEAELRRAAERDAMIE